MPDLPDELRALLRDRAEDAPAVPAPTDRLVRTVRRRQTWRTSLVLAGAAAGVVGAVALAGSVDGDPRVASPAGRGTAQPTATPYLPHTVGVAELCTAPAAQEVEVRPYAYELTYDKKCYVALGGVRVKLLFTNATTVPHNVVVTEAGRRTPVAKTETVFAKDGVPGRDRITLPVLKPGLYQLTCAVHPQMISMLYVPR